MKWLLFLIVAHVHATLYQVEFREALWIDRLNTVAFCTVMNDTMGGVTYCNSIRPRPQTTLLLAAMQINIVNSTVDIYAVGNNLSSVLTIGLQNAGFFTLTQSSVTLISLVESPIVLTVALIIIIVFTCSVIALAMFCFPFKKRPPLRQTRVLPVSQGGLVWPPRR